MTSTIKSMGIKSVLYTNEVTTNGALQIPYPSGYSNVDTLIVQPVYNSSSLLGWSHTVQLQSTFINVYIRQGTTTPSSGSKVTFRAIFIHS